VPSITGGDQLSEDYAPHLWKNGKFVGSWEPEEKVVPTAEAEKPCGFFHGYTTNPMLCRACHRPVTEHKAYMEKLKKKKKTKAQQEEEKKEKLYDLKRKELIEICQNEIDKPDELVELGGVKMRASYLKKLQAAIWGEMQK
jgi:hypothetical protein